MVNMYETNLMEISLIMLVNGVSIRIRGMQLIRCETIFYISWFYFDYSVMERML